MSLCKRVEADLRPLVPTADPTADRVSNEAKAARYRIYDGRLQSAGGGRRGATAGKGGTAGRLVYAIGDVHGRYDLLCRLIGQISQDLQGSAGGRVPVIVFCGDYVDRGPDSALVLEALLYLQACAAWELILLKGNHEQGLLEFLDAPAAGGAWLRFGGEATLDSYGVARPDPAREAALIGARDALLAVMPASHLRLLQGLDLLAVIGDHAFVHAGVAPGTPLLKQRQADLLWIRGEFLQASRPCEKIVVHGHTWTSVEPTLLPHRIGLDTGAYETDVLTAVRLDGTSRRVLQTRETAGLVPQPADFTRSGWGVNLDLRRTASAA